MNNDVELIPVKGVLPSVQVQSDNVIYVPQAHKNKAGIVKEGDGVLIENGVVSLNKQTVEDMIDANKWVSYGFQQNLTEDEKGMARHNIGAGDNYFTGSYYDLTQKPHLNTNNTTGLDYGDEELNDTINLHKISKTGSFNDLKHVPQETLDFAESERQKSETDGAIVHEKQIADVEHIETIYEIKTKNTIGGTAYTAGIPFSNISISNVDFNKYKYLRFTCRWNTNLDNWFGGTITFDLDLQTPYNSDSNYISVISNRPSSCFISDDSKTFELVGETAYILMVASRE